MQAFDKILFYNVVL